MTEAIGAIGAASTSVASSSSSRLSEETKKKLEALGINTDNITSETEGQSKLKEAQAAQQAAQAQPQQGNDSLQTSVENFAAQMGVDVGKNDKMEDIFSNINSKISELAMTAANDPVKMTELQNFQSQYATLYSQYTQQQAAQNMTGATAMGNYNKMLLGLS